MKQKYERILEPTDTWAIFETSTGEPVIMGTRLLIGLSQEEAEQLLAILNEPPKGRSNAPPPDESQATDNSFTYASAQMDSASMTLGRSLWR
ncbi:hypothetical protein HED49_05195 [Ochrobactrum daejeonense]|nr:hypothetical protein [Brucella daejeonensis]